MDVIPMCSIRPDRIALYNEFVPEAIESAGESWDKSLNVATLEPEKKGAAATGNSSRQPNSNKTGRELSGKSAKRIQEKVEWLCLLAKKKKAQNPKTGKNFTFKVNFITLTLPVLQRHHDTTIKSVCLNQFITEARKYCNLRNYIWRAECQGNGNIHFHIISDTYLNAYLVRSIWNRCIGKLGYLDAYRNKFHGLTMAEYVAKVDPQNKLPWHIHADRWKHGNESGWKSPNTTDIHSTRKVRDLAAYLKKYVSKKVVPADGESQPTAEQIGTDPYYSLKNRRIKGRLWGCSQSLSKLKSIITVMDVPINRMVNYICDRFPEKVFTYDYATCLFVRVREYARGFIDVIGKLMKELLAETKYRAVTQSEQRYYLKNLNLSP